MSDETRRKLSESHKGNILSQEIRNKISLGNKGKFVSDETKRKLSLAIKGKIRSEETKDKLRKVIHKIDCKCCCCENHRIKNNDTQATGSNIVPPLIGAQNRLNELQGIK